MKVSTKIKKFIKSTSYCPGFVPADYDVIHVSEGKLYNCNELGKTIEADKKYMGKEAKLSFSQYGTYIMNRENQQVFLLDPNCRSQIFGLAKTTGSMLYNGTVFADISLDYAMKSLKQNQKVVIRDNRIISVLSDRTKLKNPVPLIEELEKKYKPATIMLDDYQLVVEFIIEKKNGCEFMIRFSWSDAGNVAYRLEATMRPEGIERTIVLFEADTVEEVLNGITEFYKTNPDKQVSRKRVQEMLKALGSKRLKNTPCATIGDLLRIPDAVGRINKTTDQEIERAIGLIIKENL